MHSQHKSKESKFLAACTNYPNINEHQQKRNAKEKSLAGQTLRPQQGLSVQFNLLQLLTPHALIIPTLISISKRELFSRKEPAHRVGPNRAVQMILL